jgi:hypothetical protein
MIAAQQKLLLLTGEPHAQRNLVFRTTEASKEVREACNKSLPVERQSSVTFLPHGLGELRRRKRRTTQTRSAWGHFDLREL